MSSGAIGTKALCYRLTLVEDGWHLMRPDASMPRAFDKLDDALAYVGTDNRGASAIVEIRAEGTYMVKRILPHR
jgi:hypothetical protein